MNVIFTKLIKHLKLKMNFLIDINFTELFMRTTNHREIILHN